MLRDDGVGQLLGVRLMQQAIEWHLSVAVECGYQRWLYSVSSFTSNCLFQMRCQVYFSSLVDSLRITFIFKIKFELVQSLIFKLVFKLVFKFSCKCLFHVGLQVGITVGFSVLQCGTSNLVFDLRHRFQTFC